MFVILFVFLFFPLYISMCCYLDGVEMLIISRTGKFEVIFFFLTLFRAEF